MNSLYFDHAATTRPHASVVAAMLETLEENFANPSSLHRAGLRAERLVEAARSTLAGALSCTEEELIFTSGGTEANYLALAGTVKSGDHVLTTPLEHSSIRATLDALEARGVTCSELLLEEDGTVDLEALDRALEKPVRLVSVQQVNNETGIIQPLEEIARRVKRKDAGILLHSDGIQGFGKFPGVLSRIPLDLYSVSGHKIGGPKGIGALYIRRNTPFYPPVTGGGQEGGRRGGTQNVPGIAGFAQAVREWEQQRTKWTEHAIALRRRFLEGMAAVEEISVQSPPEASPFILSMGFADCKGEVLLHMLEQQEISVSTGSACAKGAVSRVLTRLEIPNRYAQGTLRISFGAENTLEDVDFLVHELQAGIALMRTMTRRKE